VDNIRDLAGALALGLVGSYTMGGFIHPARHCDYGAVINLIKVAAHCKLTSMKPAAIVGIILIIVGIIGFAWGGLGWTTQEDAQLGLSRSPTRKAMGSLFRRLLAGCLIGGIALLVIGSRKS
jgi:hypothetical protein